MTWPLPADLDDTRMGRLLFPPPPDMPAQLRGIPDWQAIHKELRHKHVTLFLLWQEYRAVYPDGYQYSWFCDHYRNWRGKLDMVMHQDHRAGEKLFVDSAGQTAPVIDRATGDPRGAGLCGRTVGLKLQLHLRRSHLDPGLAGLDWLPSARLALPWRRAGTGRAGQPAVRGEQGSPLRARHQPHLLGHGLPLRDRGIASTAAAPSPRNH